MPKLGTLLLVLWIVANGPHSVSPADETESGKQGGKVSLVIDYGDGVEKHFTELSWKEGITVLDTMQLAKSHRRGIRIEQKGSGSTAIITKIDDLENEGRGKNWIYRVNGKLADTGAGVRKLEKNDSVLWRFEAYR